MTKGERLFEAVFKVTRVHNEDPRITFLFPESNDLDPSVASVVPLFCFPESQTQKSTPCETFSFILTAGDGSKQFGYCMRFMDDTTPQCFCILSYLDSFSLFSSILEVITQRELHGGFDSIICFLCSALSKPIPQPGETLVVSTFSDSDPTNTSVFSISHHLVLTSEQISFGELFSSLGVDNVINLFEALVLECRIIFVSKKLSQLSSCVSAAVALINPLAWQYVFIPILPSQLLTYCCAPMPFLVGVTESSLEEIYTLPTEELLVVQCDQGKFLRKPEQNTFLSDEMRLLLRKSISRISGSCKKEDKVFDLNIARCFVNFMYRLVGNYYKFMDENGVLDNETFLECQPPQFQSMIEVIQRSQMWEGFLREREIWKQKDLLDSCVLLKEAHDVWCVEDLSLTCCKCKQRFTENGHTKSGRFYCHPCFEAKFSLIDKRLIETSSTKMKKVGKTLTRRMRNVANDMQKPSKVAPDSGLLDDSDKLKKATSKGKRGSEIKLSQMKSSFGLSMKSKKRRRSVTTGNIDSNSPADDRNPLRPSQSFALPCRDEVASVILSTSPVKSSIITPTTPKEIPQVKPISAPAEVSMSAPTSAPTNRVISTSQQEPINNDPVSFNCKTCGRMTETGNRVTCNQFVWHKKCMPCGRCLLPIDGECKMVDNKIYHANCEPLRLRKSNQ